MKYDESYQNLSYLAFCPYCYGFSYLDVGLTQIPWCWLTSPRVVLAYIPLCSLADWNMWPFIIKNEPIIIPGHLQITMHLSCKNPKSSLVFHRKDLCEARVNFKVSSYFQTRCTIRQADPSHKTVSNSRSSIAWSMSSMRTQLKWLAELGQVFRQGVPSDEMSPHLFRWPVPRQN